MGERTDEVTTVHRFERTNPEEVYEVEETAREVPDRRTGVEDLGFGASRLDANGFLDADDSLAIETDQGTDEGDNTTAEIEATRQEIEQTRNNMSQTIDAIQQRLNPQALMDQAKESAHEMVEHAKDSVREATIGRAQQAVNNVVESAKDMVSDVGDSARGAGSSIVDVIQRNPIPAALAALGLGWLFMSARNDAASPAGYRRDGESAGGRRYRRGIYEFQGDSTPL